MTINALWVIASVAVVAADVFSLTAPGVLFVLAQAFAVALFTVAQSVGLQRSLRQGRS